MTIKIKKGTRITDNDPRQKGKRKGKIVWTDGYSILE